MNIWLLFILGIILFHYLLETVIFFCNRKSFDPKLPKEFNDIFDQNSYAKSQHYNNTTNRFSFIEKSITTLITVLFIIFGGFNEIDLFARSFGGGPIITGIIFSGCLILLSFLISFPFSFYSTFKIEADFGFNKTTYATFFIDILKGILLILILGVPLFAGILYFFNTYELAWLYCWLTLIIFSLVMQFLAPVLIMPLFNKFTPMTENSLTRKITDYLEQENFKIKGIFTMDGSKRSTKLNAFFTGFGKFKKIVFFDTLLEKLSEDEILAVLAHETGHFKKKHIWKMFAGSIIQTGITFFLLSFFLENRGLFSAFHMQYVSIYASIVFFAFLYSPINTILSLLFNYISRIHEFEADRYAAESTRNSEFLIQGLKKLSRENLSNLTPHPLTVFFSYSHPPVLERIRALKNL